MLNRYETVNTLYQPLYYKVKQVEKPRKIASVQTPPPQKVMKRFSKEVEEECYSNKNEYRGICLILEHDVFAPNLQLRFVHKALIYSRKNLYG